MAQSALKFPPRASQTRVALHQNADGLLATYHKGLRELKKTARIPDSDQNMVKDVVRGRPQSAQQLFTASASIVRRAEPKQVRRFAVSFVLALMDISETCREGLSIVTGHKGETKAVQECDNAQIDVLANRHALTIEQIDTAIRASENQIIATEVYISTLRAERAKLVPTLVHS